MRKANALPGNVGDDEGCGDVPLEQQEFRQVLQACQQRLSAQHLAVFVLRFVEELPAEAIFHSPAA